MWYKHCIKLTFSGSTFYHQRHYFIFIRAIFSLSQRYKIVEWNDNKKNHVFFFKKNSLCRRRTRIQFNLLYFHSAQFQRTFWREKKTLSNFLVHQKQFSTRAAIAIDLLSSHYWTNYHFHSDKQQKHYSQRSNTIFYFRERKHTHLINNLLMLATFFLLK